MRGQNIPLDEDEAMEMICDADLGVFGTDILRILLYNHARASDK
jgi:hypothetical protein